MKYFNFNFFSATQTNENQTTVTSTGDSSDVQVVEEKLTYVYQHAKLSAKVTTMAFNTVESLMKEKNMENVVLTAFEKVINHYCIQNKENSSNWNTSKSELLSRDDPRLESFVKYLLRNDETKNMPLVELAVLEQFSFAGLEYNLKAFSSFR